MIPLKADPCYGGAQGCSVVNDSCTYRDVRDLHAAEDTVLREQLMLPIG